jgi:hypothetical protein
MSAEITLNPVTSGVEAVAGRPRAARVPWMVWTSAAATTSVVVGSIWDISWHISVGRDTFWTPPHLLIQLCAAIGGLTAVYLIARATFAGDDKARGSSACARRSGRSSAAGGPWRCSPRRRSTTGGTRRTVST